MNKNRKKITTTLSFLMIAAMILTSGGLITASAQPPPLTKKTYPYIGLIPETVGVNQEVLLHIGIPATSPGTAYGWEGLTVTVTRPDGTSQTLGPFTTDSTGGTGTAYVPTQVGIYTFQTNFPEQQVPITYFDFNTGLLIPAGSTFQAGSSEVQSLTVSEDPIVYYPDIPLLPEFWSRPVDAQFRGWSGIAGNWPEIPVSRFAPHNDAPETAHILWTKPLTIGGLAGGDTGEHGMECGDAYEGKWPDPVIMNGVLYYNRYAIQIFDTPLNPALGVIAVDLRTGEELWVKEGIQLSFGQQFYFTSHNYHGVFDYLWEVQGSTWNAYDPFTSDWSWSMTDVPSGVRYNGPNGEFYILVTDLANGWMALWNQSSLSLQEAAKDFFDPVWAQGSWGRNIEGKTINSSTAYSWNVTIPTNLPPGSLSFGETVYVIDDRVVGLNLSPTRDRFTIWALSLKEGQEGQLLFNKDWTPPTEWQAGLHTIRYGTSTPYGPSGIITIFDKELRKHYGFSLDNGAYLWETEAEHYLQQLSYFDIPVAYDKFYSVSVAGIINCYDINTGDTVWTYVNEDVYSEYLFGNNWWGWIPFVSDGKVYMMHTEHSVIDPKPRGAPFVCLDAETGDVVWKADGFFRGTEWGGDAIIGDSIIATMDTYDQRIYAIGKGPSQTVVEAPKTGIPQGSSIVLCGSVTDISAGTSDPALTARFPNGVACVSDESMTDWMGYVYKQFPFPADANGVNVSLDVIDANGNFRNIGTATSDSSGFYSIEWKPDIPGKYTVIATFAGSEAYYASYAEAAFVVDEAPEPTPTDPTPAPQTDATLLGLNVAAVVAIIVFGLLILLMLRKR